MVKNIIILLLSATVAFQFFRQAPNASQPQQPKDSEELAMLRQKIRQLQNEHETVPQDTAKASSDKIDSRNLAVDPIIDTSTLAKKLADLLERPSEAKIALDFIKAKQRSQYASMFARLHLPSDKEETLRNVLAENEAERLENYVVAKGSGVNAMNTGMVEQLDAEFSAKLKDLLGPGLAKFVQQVSGPPYFSEQMQNIDSAMEFSGAPLNDEQYQKLLQDRIADNARFSPPATEQAAEKLVQEQQEQNQRILARASTYLDKVQLATLEAQLGAEVAQRHILFLGMVDAMKQWAIKAPPPPQG